MWSIPRSGPLIALGLLLGGFSVSCATLRVGDDQKAAAEPPSRQMPDGKWWMTTNLDVRTGGSYCYDDAEPTCRRYGRLYTWEAATQGCRVLGDDWRLPTNDEWQQMAQYFGGVADGAPDRGKAAYEALVDGGRSGFNALLGGGRAAENGQYARLEAHGFYWTASDSDSASAWFYNFGRGSQALFRHGDGEKQRAFSARCVKAGARTLDVRGTG